MVFVMTKRFRRENIVGNNYFDSQKLGNILRYLSRSQTGHSEMLPMWRFFLIDFKVHVCVRKIRKMI